MNGIGWAVKQLQDGQRVARADWQRKGMYLFIAKREKDFGMTRGLIGLQFPPDAPERHMTVLPTVCLKCPDDVIVVGFSMESADLLAMDWDVAGPVVMTARVFEQDGCPRGQ